MEDNINEIPTEFENATRGERLGAALIDALIITVVIIPLAYFMGYFENFGEVTPPLNITIVLAIVGFALYFLVNGKLLHTNGQTIGKKFNGIRIVKLDGTKPDIKELLVRRYIPYFGFPYIPYIGSFVNLINLCFIFGKEKRCLHDKIAGTKVVKS
ncbi:RDD family protein [Marinomonas rhizomae]|uniref:RDD family protein n=1 Tax=Marinomonas rhizomae TaxID=491948 RepID=UPI002107159D|nr:RDD family protein [Marinomonas rhizomae]UTV98269.1 RDD family protein [Marinomonas rhizomae]